jgi:Amt family ammonium transporter
LVVVLGIVLLDRLGVDDPVGAVPVHGMNGIWGTLAVGLFAKQELLDAAGLTGCSAGLLSGGGLRQLGVQALGVVAAGLFAAVPMAVVFMAIKKAIGLRVTKEEELRGLDIGEHGMEAYSGFQIFTTQ